MLRNFSLPNVWANADDEIAGPGLPNLDINDRATSLLLHAIAELNDRERSLVLVMVQSVAVWGGLKSAA